jgi:hypothetical protein
MAASERIDLFPGAKVGRWTLETLLPAPSRGKHTQWACLCECGARSNVDSQALCWGKTKSCGCGRQHTTTPDGASKLCSGCKQFKPMSAFAHRHRRRLTVPVARCRDCRAVADKLRAPYLRRWKAAHTYGLTATEYDALYAAAQSRCQICGVHEDDIYGTLCIDHCHATGRVRGLLCRNCNSALGKFNDDPKMLRAAAEYLEVVR